MHRHHPRNPHRLREQRHAYTAPRQLRLYHLLCSNSEAHNSCRALRRLQPRSPSSHNGSFRLLRYCFMHKPYPNRCFAAKHHLQQRNRELRCLNKNMEKLNQEALGQLSKRNSFRFLCIYATKYWCKGDTHCSKHLHALCTLHHA